MELAHCAASIVCDSTICEVPPGRPDSTKSPRGVTRSIRIHAAPTSGDQELALLSLSSIDAQTGLGYGYTLPFTYG